MTLQQHNADYCNTTIAFLALRSIRSCNSGSIGNILVIQLFISSDWSHQIPGTRSQQFEPPKVTRLFPPSLGTGLGTNKLPPFDSKTRQCPIVETCCNRVDSFHSKPFSCVVGTCTKLEVINKHCPFSFALTTCNMGKLLHSTSITKYYWHERKSCR